MPQSGGRPRGLAPALEQAVGVWIGRLAWLLALIGGAGLIAMMAMTVASIAGREIAALRIGGPFNRLGPVPGDFELVAIGSAFAVFSFLPWCQYRRGHIAVDLFFMKAPPRLVALSSLVGNLLMTAAAAFIAWRLGYGLADKRAYSETTFILQMPVWWGYAAALLGAWTFALVSLYTVWRSFNEMLGTGEEIHL